MENIILIGGGEIAKGETSEIDNSIKNAVSKNATFAFFGAASGDAPGYAETIQEVFGDHFNVIDASEDKGKEFSEHAIETADVIYLGGGMTQLLMDHFEKWDLVDRLRQAIERGALVVGMSAGAQALSSQYIHEESDEQELRMGWGLLGRGGNQTKAIMVHANSESISRAERLLESENLDLCAIKEGVEVRFSAEK